MKVIIVGGGWTGLTAAYRLSQKGHEVAVWEKETRLGGLAGTFRRPDWNWELEKFYHHWFANDQAALNLARELGQKMTVYSPQTKVWHQGREYPLDSAVALAIAPFLSFSTKLRAGAALAYLKLSRYRKSFGRERALPWLRKYMGKEMTKIVWEPLLVGKFGRGAEKVSLSWFYARIKKRTKKLAYPEGGFANMRQKLELEIIRQGGKIVTHKRVKRIYQSGKKMIAIASEGRMAADKILMTVPTEEVIELCPGLPKRLTEKWQRIKHLSAQVLVLELRRPLLRKTYWLNITERNYPFLAVVEHTNMIAKENYANHHLAYVGNYLPKNHPYLSMTARKLLKEFTPYLNEISPDFQKNLLGVTKWQQTNAQPVVDVNYQKRMPRYELPIPNLYLANLDMVYPWDRGTNYAVVEGEKIARIIVEKL